ncbi:EF-Hand 1, calcium-binding site [Phytophthora cactorum]|nr:EF-Hand 1, calcium-binding site [Phytophthora cactorum]
MTSETGEEQFKITVNSAYTASDLVESREVCALGSPQSQSEVSECGIQERQGTPSPSATERQDDQDAARVSAVTLLLGERRVSFCCAPVCRCPSSAVVAAGFPGVNKTPVALFENASFHLVFDDEPVGTQEPIRKGNRYRHRTTPQTRPRARGTPGRREYQAVTTTSEANGEDEDVDDSEEEEKDFEAASTEDELDLDLSDFELPQLVNKILSQSGRYDPQARKMFTRLFNIFEEQSMRNDIVDVADFLGGVSVFACGERDEKIQLTFELYDMDGDGFISKEEMTKYLTAVFLVIGESSPELFQQNNKTVFCRVNTESGGKAVLRGIPKMVFEAWTYTARRRQTCKTSASKTRDNGVQASEGLDLATLREITGLSALSASDLFSIFSAASTNNGGKMEVLTRADFLDRLFDAFDEDESDSVDFVEVSTGLSVLCGDSNEDKQEMETYLASVFHVMYETTPATRQSIGIDAKTLAHYTTKQAFEESDVNRDGKLSLEEFRSWYWVYGRHYQQHTMGPPTGHQSQPGDKAFGTSNFVASLTGLQDRAPSDVFEVIAAKVNEDGVLSREAFFSIVDELVEEHAANTKRKLSVEEKNQLQKIMETVFDGFDTDHDGFVDFCELSSGISVLCSGSQEEKIKSTFTLFDINQDGFISRDEMETYLASITTADAFSMADTNQDDRLSFEEFTKWYSTQGAPQLSMMQPQQPAVSSISSQGVLNEMKELTNLGAYDVNDIFEFFQASADREGNVSQPVFFRCFNKLLAKDGRISRETQMKTQQLLKELFELFDADKNGVVDVQELGAGLSILCGGSRADKAKSMFTLYDVNHDGYISPEEMTSYLTSVFKVMFKASPELPAKTGMTPEQLAKTTTRECFRAFDHNLPIDVAKKLSGLEGMSLDEVSEIFASATGGGKRISRRIFDECFYKHICSKATPGLSVDDSTRVHEVIDRLFTAFDTEQKGIVDFNELISGLSILCGAYTRDEKVLSAFKVYDTNGDGVISEDEMTHYLGSVFKLLYALDPTRQQQLGISAKTLAGVTTSEIFEVADVSHDGKLNFEEFQKWYSRPEQSSFNDIVAPLDLNEVRQLTNLGNLDVVEVFERFAEHADEDGMLNRESFDKCFFEIIEMAHPRTQIEKLRAKMVADRLYDVFDRDGNGQIDFSELASGLSVLCKGARDAKVRAAFRLYDFNEDGFISLDEMKRYLTSIFKVLYEVQPEMRQETGVSAEELGVVTAEQAFLEADSNHDGKLSYDEFLTWYNSPAQAGISSAVAKNAIVDSSLHWMPLNEIKQLTNLAQYEPEEVFEIFAGEADEDGLLSRDAFNESFRKVLSGQKSKGERASDAETQKNLQEVIDGLFDLFDRDNSGAVDFGELASGLSVLCGGTKDQKVEAAFSLFDFNGDGFISLDEMTRYLTSVFRVLFQVSPDTQSLGVTPEELGEVTAQQAFAEADQDHDGQLTLKEFQQWYQQPGGIGEVAKNGEQLFSLAEARRLTNLQAFSPMEVFEALAECADEQGYVSREAFDKCFRKIISMNQGIKSEEYQRINTILNRLFELFDVDKNGMVDFSEISSGLSVFCGGSSEEKIRAAFALYDYNADGYISMEEMTRYLTPATNGTRVPEELGVRTAQQAFEEADLDHDGRLSFPEFRKWYTRSNAANMERLIQNNIPEWLSLREVRRLTNLESFTAQQVLNTFAKFTAADGTMDQETFRQAFDHFKVESATQESRDRLQLLVDRIFELFDKDSNGLVDFNELASGLSVLCGGSQTDKVRAAFNLYDVNHDGFISLGEMRLYLTSVFKVLFEVNPDSEARMGVTPEDLGEITAEQAFAEADHDRDGKLSFEEFSQWYMQPKRVGDIPVPAVLGEQQQQKRKAQQQVPDWVSLDVVKQMTNLEKYTADEVFEIFANRCSENGTLSREAFEECFEQLVDEQYKNDEVSLARLRLILNRLFVIFDENHDGTVDFCELTSGLSVLCGGSREEKVRAAFSLYDLNQDGFISLDEMVRYLASVFKVLYETSPGTDQQLGVQPEELAKITAEQCFLETDLNEDGKLSFDEFVAWYSKSSGFEAPAAGVSSILGQQQATSGSTSESHSEGSLSRDNSKVGSHSGSPAPESPRKTVWGTGKGPHSSGTSTPAVTFPPDKIYGITGSNGDALLSPNSASALNMNSSNMEHVRQLLKLDTYEVNDVLEIFAEAAPSGELTFAAFKKCFDQIIRLAGGHESPEERQEADGMIRRLFLVFDTDGSNTVDFGELASGLSVLSGSSMDDKVRAAFQLYDINGDGYITQEEMISYMTSIFKVMYETTDSTKTKIGVSPEDLARVTADQCFKEADLNGDNKLSFEEFKKVRKT